ncbi:MAG: class I SAM-dependent methyltransferase [Chloroflexi bacterium]|nr:class I SAM-dependent methyltransferase [Chloroflexota bacterium]
MDREAFSLMASHEAHHWWFVGRRAVIDAVLDRLPLAAGSEVLEAGCGTGGNLFMLERRGHVSAFEPSVVARDIAALRRQNAPVVVDGELPDRLPFEAGSFDLVVALDVLEHIERDQEALGSLVAMAKPGGYVLVTVPAHPILWGAHDRRLHHIRRYRRSELKRICASTGCEIRFFTAFNTILAPIAVTLRLLERIAPISFGNQERMPPAPVNRLLGWLFALEGAIVRRTPLPFGVSYAAILRRPAQGSSSG